HIFIDPFSVHAFRDTFASRAARAGIAPNTLKEILGHVSLAMTMDLYAHINELDKKEGMEKLQAIDL
ncbi:MAG: tyrosine-type recombinase/integrase, partial [Dialister sp.]|nr:tyrosine-type recombinase/integrase [Dialister sp.]